MRIIVVGEGKVGSTIVKQLSMEGHDVVIIDNDPLILKNASNTMDVFCVEGNGASYAVQQRAEVGRADLLIAATSADEVNMLCCLIGKKQGVKHTIARVRNPEYFFQMDVIKEELGLSMTVNPELLAADEIARLLKFPSALKIETFAKGRVELIEYKIAENSPLAGMPLFALYKEYQVKVLICAVQRGNEVYIPAGDFVLQAGDKINLTASREEIVRFFRAIGVFSNKIKRVLLIGGGRIAYYLANHLISTAHMKIKIIEKDLKRCEYLCEHIPEAVIIHGDGTDRELLTEEGLEKTDAVVMLTGMDEENIVVSMLAKACKVSKVIAKVNRISFPEILNSLEVDSFISPKSIAANSIVRYVRAMQNSMGSNVETLHMLINDQVEALEFRVRKGGEFIGIPLKDLKTKKGILIATIVRQGKIIIPGGNDTIEVGDGVIVVTTNQYLSDLKDILQHTR